MLLAAGAGLCGAANPPTQAPAPTRTILVLGDSLSAEYGLQRGTGWVALLDKRLQSQHKPARIVNASISGETTSGGRSRLSALLAQHRPTHVIIELGANDGLRGLPPQSTQDNLDKLTQAAQKAGAQVLLIGMRVPPNYGQDYSRRFASLFRSVAQKNNVALVPFFLRGVADVPDAARLFQNDRIHPTEAAQSILLDNVWPELNKLMP
jgi:acyl-CoA thioesterase-1